MIGSLNARLRGAEPMYDQVLLWVAIVLLAIGFVMVYSSSIAIAEADKATGYQTTYYVVRQGIYLVMSLVAAVITFQFPMQFWQKMAPWFFLASLVTLVLVLIPGIGLVAGGSRRWISLVVLTVQPSEFMKLFATMYVADYTLRKAAHMDSFTRGFLPMLVVMLIVGGLLLMEPDFGAFAVIASIAMSILWLGGINVKIFVGLFVMLVVGFITLILSSPYRLERVVGFMDPWADPYGKGYQLSHALIAFGRGEWFGVGLGASVEKLLYLPEAHTDFLLSVIAEEIGFVGVAVVIGLFMWLVMRAFSIGRECIENERYFGSLLAQGLGVWFGVQGIINMGVNMGLLPTKGLTLPFLSYGGSGILANCIATAILLRIDFENRRLQKGLPV